MSTAHYVRRSVALVVGILLLGTLSFAQKNLLYIETNDTNANSVLAFSNDGTGVLTPLTGSPFLTGGTGVLFTPGQGDAQIDADQQLIIDQSGTLLFAVNGHSNTVSVFQINSDGTLTAAAASPFASGGPQPASVGIRNDAFGAGSHLAVVVNKDSDPNQTASNPNYTTFTVNSAGVMTMNPGSTFPLAAGISPSQALMSNRQKNKFFGIEFMNSLIAYYKVSGHGIIAPVSSVVAPGSAAVTLGSALHPTLGVLYVSLPLQAQILTYQWSLTGTMSLLNTAANQGLAVCWMTINQAGNRLYTTETNSGSITVYDTTRARNPVQLQHLTLLGTTPQPAHIKLDPTGKFLYILDRKRALHVLNVNADGTVVENLPAIPLNINAGQTPVGLDVLMK
jgi:6-phosphogluconolactonase (cycloisomerase 2 family)